MVNQIIYIIVLAILYIVGVAINFIFILDIIRINIYDLDSSRRLVFRKDTGYNLYLVYLIDILYLMLLTLGSIFTMGIILYYLEEV